MSQTETNPYDQEEKLDPRQFVRNWAPMTLYTTIFTSISVVFGPVTPGRSVSRWAMQQWAIRVSASLGIQCKLEGAEILDTTPQCVFIANHCSALDILIIGSKLPRDYRWLAKAPLFRTPFLGWHLSAGGHIPVFRGNKRARNKNIQDRVALALEEGANILYFPEGTRNPDGNLQPFKKGAFVTAATHNLPIVPIVLKGTGELMKKGARHLNVDRTRLCVMSVLPPFWPSEDITDHDEQVASLGERAREIFETELGQKTVNSKERSEAGQ